MYCSSNTVVVILLVCWISLVLYVAVLNVSNKNQSHVMTDGQSASLSCCQAPIINFFFLSDS
jgi:nitric oxide reductase large subunit